MSLHPYIQWESATMACQIWSISHCCLSSGNCLAWSLLVTLCPVSCNFTLCMCDLTFQQTQEDSCANLLELFLWVASSSQYSSPHSSCLSLSERQSLPPPEQDSLSPLRISVRGWQSRMKSGAAHRAHLIHFLLAETAGLYCNMWENFS